MEANDQISEPEFKIQSGNVVPYFFHCLYLLIGYVLPVILTTLIMIPFMGPYVVMLPMMIFGWSWKIFPAALVALFFFKEIFENYMLKSYVASVFLVWAYFIATNIFLITAFSDSSRGIAFIYLFPLLCSAIFLLVYFLLLKRSVAKRSRHPIKLVKGF